MKPSIPKGTRDFGPEVMVRRDYIFDTIRAVFRKYGYAPLQTPSMEKLNVLTGKYGEEGDRLIFKILNSGDFLSKTSDEDLQARDARKLVPRISEKALRYDLTVPFARYVSMNQGKLVFPFKRYQIQPVWRADKPQKGRYREFYQCDADVVGSNSLIYEAEFLAIFDEVISTLGIDPFVISINNRKILSGYAEVIGQTEKFTDICVCIDKMDKIGPEGVGKQLGARGIPTDAIEQLFEMIQFEGNNQEKLDFLEAKFANSESGKKGVQEMREVLNTYSSFSRYKGEILFDLLLARGLDYYTGTIYEVKAPGSGIGSICGGGRYDDLTGVFGSKGLSGVGISFGADRIYDVMDFYGLFADIDLPGIKVLLINFGEETLAKCLEVLNQLRQEGVAAELYPDSVKLKKQFGFADKKNIPFTLMIGSEEMETGLFNLKNMETGEQEKLALTDLIQKMK